MDVHSLRVFVKVAEELSLTRAGELLSLSQSAVSHQIAKLERETQVRLLERSGRTVSLTPAGESLRQHALDIIGRVDDLVAIVRAAGDPSGGSLRIGASVTACQHLLPDPLRELRECFPRISIAVLPGDSPQIGQWVADGQVDVGVIVRGDRGDRAAKLATRPLFRDQLGLVMHPSHELAPLKLTATNLSGKPWVLYNRSSTTSRLIERHLTRLNIGMGNAIELGAFEAIKELVKLGLGLGVMAKWVVRTEVADGSLLWRQLPGPKLEREWSLALPVHRAATVIEETLFDLCRRTAKGLIPAH